jgi:hypothetical protein
MLAEEIADALLPKISYTMGSTPAEDDRISDDSLIAIEAALEIA